MYWRPARQGVGVVGLVVFTMGMNKELEHGKRHPEANITNDEYLSTGKISLGSSYGNSRLIFKIGSGG